MGGKSARKGANGERELAAILRDHGYDIQRGGSLSFGEVPDLFGLPTVFHRANRQSWRVTMALTDWLELYRNCYPPSKTNRGE